MKIFNHFQHINLTNDQRNALESLSTFLESDERVFVLQGYAGSGKTTLLKGFVKYLESIERKYQLMAPTGRAAKVINQKTGFEASTIHRGIYSFGELKEISSDDSDSDVSFLYQYEVRDSPDTYDSILIIDEASMVSDMYSEGEFFRFGTGYLLQDLLSYGRMGDTFAKSKIIFIGDPAQLPPVGMNHSPALDTDYLKDKYQIYCSSIEMKENKRQISDNGILNAATKVRQCLTAGYFNHFDLRDNNSDIFNLPFDNFIECYQKEKETKVIICYKNKTAHELNEAIRLKKFGLQLGMQPTDIVISGGNSYKLGIMNGEFGVVAQVNDSLTVREVRFKIKEKGIKKTISIDLRWQHVELLLPDENSGSKVVKGYLLENFLNGGTQLTPYEQRALYIDFKNRYPELRKGTKEFKEAIAQDDYFNCLKLKYGYAVTCHKAQGGEWANTFIFWDIGIPTNFNFFKSEHSRTGKTNADFYRWAYTAVTRASKKLFCINPPYFSSFSSMSFIDMNVQKVFGELTGQQTSLKEINITDVLPELEKFGIADTPLTIQDHFIHHWYNLKNHFIDIEAWQRVGYEIRYQFKRENHTAAFKYWINGKDVFKTSFQKLPAQTNSNELFEDVTKILGGSSKVLVNRNNAEGILTQIQFDIVLEEEKPFLKDLFDQLTCNLNDGEVISAIHHYQYRERYTIEKNGVACEFDFEYNDNGFFGRVLPLEKKCHSSEVLAKIKEIVNNLKATDYVI
jgi:energy-coupling factor transporter ATP-binding protein EcfA2